MYPVNGYPKIYRVRAMLAGNRSRQPKAPLGRGAIPGLCCSVRGKQGQGLLVSCPPEWHHVLASPRRSGSRSKRCFAARGSCRNPHGLGRADTGSTVSCDALPPPYRSRMRPRRGPRRSALWPTKRRAVPRHRSWTDTFTPFGCCTATRVLYGNLLQNAGSCDFHVLWLFFATCGSRMGTWLIICLGRPTCPIFRALN